MNPSNQAHSVPFNDLSRSTEVVWAGAQARWSSAITSGRLILGTGVSDFEQQFADYLGGGHAVGVASGTDALELALRAAGVVAGSHVGLAANAGFYATCALLAIGAHPVYADLAEGQITPGLSEVTECIGQGRIEAFVITHLYGRVAEGIDSIARVCESSGVTLVEDCSQSHGARLGSRMTGGFGDAAAFSFYPTKNLGSFGDGGTVFTRSSELAGRVRTLRQYGWLSKYTVVEHGGRNSRLDELQAIILMASLPGLDERNESRRRIIDAYVNEVPGLGVLSAAADREAWVGHLCVVGVDDRAAVRAQLSDRGIATDVHFPIADHRQPLWNHSQHPALPHTEALTERVLSVPCFPDMTCREIEQVALALKAVIHV